MGLPGCDTALRDDAAPLGKRRQREVTGLPHAQRHLCIRARPLLPVLHLAKPLCMFSIIITGLHAHTQGPIPSRHPASATSG